MVVQCLGDVTSIITRGTLALNWWFMLSIMSPWNVILLVVVL